jgi:hypothetical protein
VGHSLQESNQPERWCDRRWNQATSLTAWIYSAIPIGVSFFLLFVRRFSLATTAAKSTTTKRANDALQASCPGPGPSPVSCKPPLDCDPNFDYEGACYELFEAADLADRAKADCTGCPACMADKTYTTGCIGPWTKMFMTLSLVLLTIP